MVSMTGIRICIIACMLLPLSSFSMVSMAGPDLFTCQVGAPTGGFTNYGSSNNIRAYAITTIACNQGDQPVRWIDEGPDAQHHPVLIQNMYRLRNGRLVQIGMSWAKHGFGAQQESFCTQCQPGGNQDLLGVGCCDVYGSVVNGDRSRLGPRSEINPATGVFSFPFCTPANGGLNCPTPTALYDRRLQVRQSELDTNPDALYFIEVHYLTSDDAQAVPRTDFNNASFRRVTITSQGDLSAWQGATVVQEPAIKAWKMHGLGPDTPDPDVVETVIDIPNDGRFWIAAKATDLGDGTWHYEYAIQNFNSDRSAGHFRVPLNSCVPMTITNTAFRDVDYHSGEPYSGTQWTIDTQPTHISWNTETYAQNTNANALRWGTLYNFRFRADRPPTTGQITLGLFKPGTPSEVTAVTVVPSGVACASDVSPEGGDCQINVNDLLAVINGWGPCPAPPAACPADIIADQTVNVNDLLAVINTWGPCQSTSTVK